MSRYEEDVASLERWEKIRLVTTVAGMALMVLGKALDVPWMSVPQATLAAAAGVALVFEGRALSRLGRSPTIQYVAAVGAFVAAWLIW